MWTLFLLACAGGDVSDEAGPFLFQNEHSGTYNARVEDTDGNPVTGAILSVRATNASGDTEQLARGVSTWDGTARIRAIVPNGWSDLQIVAIHPDYELAAASATGWSEEDGWDDTIALSLTAR